MVIKPPARLIFVAIMILVATVALAQTLPQPSGGGGGGTPGGSNTQLQYNKTGALGGTSGATATGSVVTLSSPSMNGTVAGQPTWASSQTFPSLVLGSATGGAQGAGSVNVQSFYLNGSLLNVINILTNTAAYPAITNTVSETYFGIAADGKVAAGTINAVGHSLNLTFRGIYSATNTATLTLRVKLCTVSGCGSGTVSNLAVTGAVNPAVAVTNQGWWSSVDCNVVTAGATGTLNCAGFTFYSLTGLTALQADDMVNTGTITIDTTVDEYISVSLQYNEASASDTDTLQIFRAVVY